MPKLHPSPAIGESAYTNPIFAGDYADPSIIKVGEDFYVTHSSFQYAPGLLIWRSRDLIHWTPVVHALKTYDGNVYAPELVHHHNRLYIYYACILANHVVANHVITAPSIGGPWSEPVDLCVGDFIDPGHLAGPDGKRYLYFSAGVAFDLADDGMSIASPQKKLYDGWPIPANWCVEGHYLESPKLTFHDGWYRMFSAQGGTGGPATSHMMIEARSRSPLGPWENSPYNPVIHTYSHAEKWWSRGHGTVFDDGTGRWWCMYHAYDRENLPLGRQTLMEPIEWTKDGWARVRHEVNPADLIPAPKLPATQLPALKRSDDFVGPKLGLQWQVWDEYDANRVTFIDNALVMKGKGTSAGDSNPLACIAGDNAYQIEVEVEIGGDAQAGLILFYNPRFYAGLGIATNGLWAGERGELRLTKFAAPIQRMLLRLICDHNNIDFLAGPDRNSLKKVYNGINVSGYTHQTLGGFLSLRPALYCSGGGHATFRKFRYEAVI